MNDHPPTNEPTTMKPISHIPTYIVGVGASAGGLESLERLFEHMPCDTGMAFVVIQHLSPDFKTMMDELLARHTIMPVLLATDQTTIQANTVYLLPPRKEMIIAEGRLLLTDRESRNDFSLPIDRFFRSLAQDAGEQAIGIILSGSGSDGSRGIQDIRKAGGLVLSESEQTAKFNGMPLSAQATGVVNQVLAPKDMPHYLLAHADRPAQVPALIAPVPDEGIEAIFELLRNECGIDFSHYKPSTITRRIERRLQLTHTNHLDQYLSRLRQEPEELRILYADLLIGVTRFFRDAKCFLRLEQEIIPNLIKRNDPEEQIRVWVAGCATGEEAYSLAILLHEQLTALKRPVRVKIFATDVHRSSLDTAGAGIYSEEHLVDVSQERLQRYFTRKLDGYHVVPELRQLIVFAPHNVIKDAPFTRMDLVSCRNLLIYLQQKAQKKVLSLFHFGLKTGGILLLGSSETPGDLIDEFDKVDERCKIYRKRRDVRLGSNDLHLNAPNRTALAVPALHISHEKTPLLDIYDQLLNRYMPPAFLVNEERELLDSFGGAERLLKFKARRPSSDLLELLSVDLKATIAGGLRRARKERKVIYFSGIRINIDDHEEVFRLNIEPIINGRNGLFNFLVVFEPLPQSATPSPQLPIRDDQPLQTTHEHLEALEEELRYTKENLQATIEELETSNEELQATNEELVASNEELQSTNEELNSVNEELFSVNSEYQNKIGELRELNEDMHHLLESTDIGTIFLDRHLRVRRFTPRIAEVFDLMPQDIGRPLNSFSHRLINPTLYTDLAQVLRDGQLLEREVYSHQHERTYFLRLLPYRNPSRVDGVVLTLTDITAMEQARTRLKQLSAIVENSGDAIVGLDLNGHIVTWNSSAERLYGYSPLAVIGQPLATLLPPERRSEPEMFLRRIQSGESVRHVETVRLHKDGRLLDVSLTFSPVRDGEGVLTGTSCIERDIGARKAVERQLRISEQNYQDLYNHAPDMYISVALADYTVIECNETLLHLLGYVRDEVLNRLVFGLYAPESREAALRVFNDCINAGEIHDVELRLKRKDNTLLDVSLNASLLRAPDGTPLRCRLVWHDITRRKQTEAQLREEIARREQYLAMLSHELRNPLNSVLNASEVVKNAATKPDIERKARAIIERQILHMTRLLDDLLDVSRITRNKLELRRRRIDLTQTTTHAVETVKTVFAQHGVILHTTIASGPLWLDGDPDRLQQAQINLLNNAAKFSRPNTQVQLQVQQEEQTAVIRVRDQGVGIAADMIERIFDLFVQGDTSLHRSTGGMGVGLTLVRTIVQLHDGTISAHSDGPDQGSEFVIRLPLLAEPTALPHEPDTRIPADTGTLKVAVIEDLEANRTMLQALLELLGYTVCTAADGESGLVLLERERPHLALIDIGLPRLDGYELVRQFRARQPSSSVRLIALTGYSQPSDIQQAQEAGFDEYLIKPLNAEKLTALLKRWMPQL